MCQLDTNRAFVYLLAENFRCRDCPRVRVAVNREREGEREGAQFN